MEEEKDWFEEGNEWYGKGDYRKAIECYDKAIELQQGNADTYYNKGNALYELSNYQQAIECYDKAIELELEPGYAATYNNNKGNALRALSYYQKAIACYDKAIEINPDYVIAYYNKGNVLVRIGEYQQAIDCYDKVIVFTPDYASAHQNKGMSLYFMSDESGAIKCWDKAAEHDNSLSGLNPLLYDSIYFFEAIGDEKDEKKIEQYRAIYVASLKIQQELQIKGGDECEECETRVAHYTKRDVADKLFFGTKDKDEDGSEITVENPFQLNSVTNSNDKQEGKALFQYLFNGRKMEPQAEPYVAFVGCFMFNFDNLNQFRLYGKDGDKEGTGVSIVVKRDYFCLDTSSPVHQADRRSTPRDGKAPLFRCIYIDPDTNHVVSVGHRDYHTFYKTKKVIYGQAKEADLKKIDKEVRKYKRFVDAKVKAVTKGLEELKRKIDESRDALNMGTVCNLLLNLRYLVKHVAFKEEQECRVVKIKSSAQTAIEDIPKDENLRRFYLNYLPLKGNVSRVYFGPKAEGMEVFQNMLAYREEFKRVVCYRSTAPLA